MEPNTITAEGVRRIAMEQIIEASGDWAADDAANSRNAFYIAGIAVLCERICEELEASNKD